MTAAGLPDDGRTGSRETGSGHGGHHGGEDHRGSGRRCRSSSRKHGGTEGENEGMAERLRRYRPGTCRDFRRGAPATARGRAGGEGAECRQRCFHPSRPSRPPQLKLVIQSSNLISPVAVIHQKVQRQWGTSLFLVAVSLFHQASEGKGNGASFLVARCWRFVLMHSTGSDVVRCRRVSCM